MTNSEPLRRAILLMTSVDGGISIKQETQTPNGAGGMDIEPHTDVAVSYEDALTLAVNLLEMLPGKPNETKTGYALGPADADPGLIAALVETRIRETRENRG